MSRSPRRRSGGKARRQQSWRGNPFPAQEEKKKGPHSPLREKTSKSYCLLREKKGGEIHGTTQQKRGRDLVDKVRMCRQDKEGGVGTPLFRSEKVHGGSSTVSAAQKGRAQAGLPLPLDKKRKITGGIKQHEKKDETYCRPRRTKERKIQ